MKLIVGLGNPGNEYSKTRHKVGFMCMDEICKYFNVSLEQNKFNGLFGQKIINNEIKYGDVINITYDNEIKIK